VDKGAAARPIDTLAALGSARDSLVARGSSDAARVEILVAPTPEDIAALRAELAMPVAGVTPSQLFDSFDERRGSSRRHEAIDIPAPRGTPVLSAAPGRVMRLYSSKDGGLMIYAADATDRFILMYAHLDSYARGLADGATLERGQAIGYVGTTGNAPPNLPHLHFAIARTPNVARWWTGVPVNPYPLLHGP
jgi:murein DD-endopeptidase MepM/ murein hydrolase activator NlpD